MLNPFSPIALAREGKASPMADSVGHRRQERSRGGPQG